MIINKVYKGTTPFVKGYKGTTLIFDDGGLPSQYQEVEWIKSTSFNNHANYIDSGFAPNLYTVVELTFSAGSDYGNYGRLFGVGNNSGPMSEESSQYPTISWDYAVSYGGSRQSNNNRQLDTIYTIKYGNNELYQDDVLQLTWNARYWEDSRTLHIFSANGGDRDGIYKLYACKIYDDGTLVRDFVPCYIKATNEVGLYDLVTKEFYHNLGSVPFLKGGDV